MLLSPTQTRQLFTHALENRYAILAVNADSPAAIVDCLLAAEQCAAPIIIETSLWQLIGHSFGLGDPLLGMTRYLTDLAVLANSERFEKIPVVYHTDHIKGPDTLNILESAIRGLPVTWGNESLCVAASSISLDSSELSAEENIAHLCRLCQVAEECGSSPATLEMEAGVDDGLTPLDEANELFGEVEARYPGHLALWAPGVGTKHGLGPMGGFDPLTVRQHQERASELAERPIGIALHGSSGLTKDDLQAAVKAGVAKVNWSSESLLIRSAAAQKYYQTHGENLTKGHPNFKESAMDNGVQQYVSKAYLPRVIERIDTLGGRGQATSWCLEATRTTPQS